jgi:hypothetical protein
MIHDRWSLGDSVEIESIRRICYSELGKVTFCAKDFSLV